MRIHTYIYIYTAYTHEFILYILGCPVFRYFWGNRLERNFNSKTYHESSYDWGFLLGYENLEKKQRYGRCWEVKSSQQKVAPSG